MLDAYLGYFLPRYDDQIEFLVVVNGSSDRTEHIVADYADKHPQVHPLVERGKIGKGNAVKLGMAASKGELVGFVDADGATPPEAYHELLEKIGPADCIIASRWMKDSQISPKQPLQRQIASRIFNALVRVLFGFKISDTQCGAKVMRRAATDYILPQIGCTAWAFDVDLLFKLHRNGYQIVEYPSVWRDVKGSRLNIPRASAKMFVAMVRLRLLYSPFSWVVKLYHYLARKIKR